MVPRERRLVFGEVADLYERARPGYPSEAFDDIATVAGLEPGAPVLEIGCGTGKATIELARLGLDVLGIEPHPAMAEVARAKLADIPGVHIVTDAFETWTPPPDPFDLVVAAQSWHWVDPDVGFAKAADCLAGDGSIALLWNWPARYDEDLRAEMDEAYDELVPGMTRMEIGRQAAPDWTDAVADSGYFARPEMREYPWSRTLRRAAYIELLRTQSDHRLLDPSQLEALLDALGEIVDRHGGEVRIDYVCRLFLARRT
jgi:SAM-dependent methyltransferase